MPANCLQVTPDVFARFPGMRIAVVAASGLDNSTANPAVTRFWRAAWAEASKLAGEYVNAQSHPRVQPWRSRMRAIGVGAKEFPSSIEAMVRRAMKGGDPFSINPLVDFYNGVSLRHIVPAGGFDLDPVSHPLELRLTREGDRFTALDEATPVAVAAGEVAYTDGEVVLTRHFVWRQAREALISPATHAVVLVSEVLGEIEDGVVEAVLSDLRTGLRTYFDTESTAVLIDEGNPTATW